MKIFGPQTVLEVSVAGLSCATPSPSPRPPLFLLNRMEKNYNGVLCSTWIQIHIRVAYNERPKPAQYEEISV